jgi:hypothetical protein
LKSITSLDRKVIPLPVIRHFGSRHTGKGELAECVVFGGIAEVFVKGQGVRRILTTFTAKWLWGSRLCGLSSIPGAKTCTP